MEKDLEQTSSDNSKFNFNTGDLVFGAITVGSLLGKSGLQNVKKSAIEKSSNLFNSVKSKIQPIQNTQTENTKVIESPNAGDYKKPQSDFMERLNGLEMFTSVFENNVKILLDTPTETTQNLGSQILKQLEKSNELLSDFIKKTFDNQDTEIKKSTPVQVSKIVNDVGVQETPAISSDTGLGLLGLGSLLGLLAPNMIAGINALLNGPKFLGVLTDRFKNYLSPFKDEIFKKFTLVKDFEGFKLKIFDLFEGFNNKIQELWASVKSFGIKSSTKIVGVFENAKGKTKEVLIKGSESVKNKSSEIFKKTADTTKNFWNNIKDSVSNTFSSTKEYISSGVTNIKNTTKNIYNSTTEFVSSTYNSIKDVVSGGWDKAKVWANEKMLTPVKSFMSENLAPLVEKTQKIFGSKIDFKTIQDSAFGKLYSGAVWLFEKSPLGLLMGSNFLNRIGKGLIEGLSRSSSIFKSAIQRVGVSKALGFILRKLPIIGLILSVPQAIGYLLEGEPTKALMAFSAGVAGLFPGLGTGLAIALDGALLASEYLDNSNVIKKSINSVIDKSDQVFFNQQPKTILSTDTPKEDYSEGSKNTNQNMNSPVIPQSRSEILTDKNEIFSQVSYSNTYRNLNQSNLNELMDSSAIQNNVLDSYESVIKPIFRHYPDAYLSSGFRGSLLNLAVGGVSDSKHKTGQAYDIQFKNHTITEVMNAIAHNEIPGLTQSGYFLHEGSWLHAQSVPGKNKNLRTANYNKATNKASAFIPTREPKVVRNIDNTNKDVDTSRLDDINKRLDNVEGLTGAALQLASQHNQDNKRTLNAAMGSNNYTNLDYY